MNDVAMMEVEGKADFEAISAWLGAKAVRRIDTAVSAVFFIEDLVYKLKRPLPISWLHYATRAQRAENALREIHLNRLMAAPLYLGLVPVLAAGDTFHLGALVTDPDEADIKTHDAVEWLVVMRCFDEGGRLDEALEEGRLSDDMLCALVADIVTFQKEAEPVKGMKGSQRAGDILDGNFRDFADLLGSGPTGDSPLNDLERRARGALDWLAPLLDDRAEAGFIRRGHGDMHLGNLCLLDGKAMAFDCVEFNDEFATGDMAYDFAFLVMDLHFRGAARMARLAVQHYLDLTGDYEMLSALPLFMSLRAQIRAKLALIAAQSAKGEEKSAKRDEAKAYLDAALDFLAPATPDLVAVGGLSGSGKSVLARGLQGRHAGSGKAPGRIRLATDVIRKRMAGVAFEDRLPTESYTKEASKACYEALFRAARMCLAAGYGVILDAVFSWGDERAAVMRIADAFGVPFHGFWLEAPLETRIERVDSRVHDASDADAPVLRRQMGYDLGTIDWQKLEAAGSPDDVLRKALATFDEPR